MQGVFHWPLAATEVFWDKIKEHTYYHYDDDDYYYLLCPLGLYHRLTGVHCWCDY